jgi:hypothetical protein
MTRRSRRRLPEVDDDDGRCVGQPGACVLVAGCGAERGLAGRGEDDDGGPTEGG